MDSSTAPSSDRLDRSVIVTGLVVVSGSLVCLLYGLSRASSHGGFTEWSVLGWLIGGSLGLALYTWHSLHKGADSIIDVRLLTN